MSDVDRRTFLRFAISSAIAAAGLPLLSNCGRSSAGEENAGTGASSETGVSSGTATSTGTGTGTGTAAAEKTEDIKNILAVAEGDDPAKMALAAIAALGGMGKFVKKGNIVVVKPNIGWDRKPEEAANTNPEVVAAIVKECIKAKAKKVLVFDSPCDRAELTYKNSGIAKAAEDAGAKVSFVDASKFRQTNFPQGKKIKKWLMCGDALDADVFINVPIAKHHSLAKLTLGFKNLMGVMGGKRGLIHQDIGEKLVDAATVIKPHLTIIDAYRILLARGPQGGGNQHVRTVGKIIAGVDMVAADSYAVTLFRDFDGWKDIKPEDIGYIKNAYERKMGEIDTSKLKIIKC